MRGGRAALLLESKGREGWQALTSSADMSLLTLPEPDAAVLARRDEIIRQLKKLIAAPGLIVDREGCRTFETDALTAYRCIPLAVVLPASTEEVSSVLRFCHDTKLKVVPRGAGTSLCGGALPLEDAIVLGISRMSKVLAIDVTNRAARVEAGVTNIAISNAVAAKGFFYAPDPSSQLACTLGGNIAMNAGGASMRRARPRSRRRPSPVISTRSSHVPFTNQRSQALDRLCIGRVADGDHWTGNGLGAALFQHTDELAKFPSFRHYNSPSAQLFRHARSLCACARASLNIVSSHSA